MKLIIGTLVALAISCPLVASRMAVFAGGGVDDGNADIYGAFVKLSTPSGQDPYIGVITAASDPTESEDNGKYYVQLFQDTYGVDNAEWLQIDIDHVSNADDPTIVAKLEKMTGVFFGGGDQERLVTCFFRNGRKDSKTLAMIRQRYEAGQLALSGSSAGTTIQQATPMVSGGESWDGLTYGSYDHTDQDEPDNLSYDADGGFGFFTYGFLDTHFGTRGRQGRLIRLMHDLSSHGTVGVGIDENTALVMQGDSFEVVGYNGAYIIDISNSELSSSNDGAFSMSNIKMSYLTKGDVYNMTDASVTFASWKNNIKGREQHDYPMDPTIDIFSSPNNDDKDGNRKNPEKFTNVTTDLFNSALASTTHGFTWEIHPEFRLDFTKGSSSTGYVGTSGKNTYISYTNLGVSIKCNSDCSASFLGSQSKKDRKFEQPLESFIGNMEIPAFLFKDLMRE